MDLGGKIIPELFTTRRLRKAEVHNEPYENIFIRKEVVYKPIGL